MDPYKDLNRYFGSISDELLSKANRVRSIIGKRHLQSDGFYKERLIHDAIKDSVPSSLSTGTGFIVHPKGRDKNDYYVSRQADLIVYDDRLATPIFKDGDFVVVLAVTVIAAIEITSTWKKTNKLRDDIIKLQSTQVLSMQAQNSSMTNFPFASCIAFYSNAKPERLIKEVRSAFEMGIERELGLQPPYNLADLQLIKPISLYLTPKMIGSVDQKWILVRGGDQPSKENPRIGCPTMHLQSTSTNDSSKLNFHLIIGHVRQRSIEWIHQKDNRRKSDPTHRQLADLLFVEEYQTIQSYPLLSLTE